TAAQYADELLQAYWKEASAADVIRDDTFSKELIRWQEIVPGRFKATAAQTLKGIFERFRLYQQMNQAHKALRRAARERKVQQHQQILQMAEDAAAKGDTKGLYRLCRRLDSALGAGWSRRHLSIFADDTHGSWIIHNERELCDSVQHLRVLIETLESMGLQINYTKSHIVIQLRGQLVAKMQKKFFKMRHGVQCLRIQAARDIYLPCVDKLDYLGAVLSYTGFESQTVQIRAHKADSAFRQLRKPLRSRSALSTGHRVRLYRAIVLSSLVYGLVGVGVSAEVVKKVSSTVAGHMRKILRVYEHGISNVEVLRRAGIDPIAMLFAGARQLCRSIELDCFRSPGLKQRETSRIHFILEQLSAHAAQPEGMHIMYVRKAEVCEVACPECGIYFGTREGLSQHIKKKHPDIVHRSKLVFDRERHTLFGIPMCRFCHMRLHDWSSITKHIQDGHCSWVKEKIAEGHTSTELLQLIEVDASSKSSLGTRLGLSAQTSATNDEHPPVAGSGVLPADWPLYLKLDNPGNHCYANASVAAILAQFPEASVAPAGLRPLLRLCGAAALRQQAITLKHQFLMRRCVPRWDFSSTQQDAVEFTAHLLAGAQWRHGWWEARSWQDRQLTKHESGHAPLILPIPYAAFDLQDAVQAWHDRGYVYALLSPPTQTFLQLARYTGGSKNTAEAHIQDFVMMPVFEENLNVTWARYEVTAAILHYGETPHSGHYRSHLKLNDQWYITDDG
ncbi:HCN2, partial [Symbiodinium sp. KB8]